MLVTQLCLTLCDPMNCNRPGSSFHGDSPGKNTGVGCLPPPGDLPNPGMEPGSPASQALSQLSHQGSPLDQLTIFDNFMWTAKGLSHVDICRIYPFSPNLSSHPGCHTTLSRVPCAIQYWTNSQVLKQ